MFCDRLILITRDFVDALKPKPFMHYILWDPLAVFFSNTDIVLQSLQKNDINCEWRSDRADYETQTLISLQHDVVSNWWCSIKNFKNQRSTTSGCKDIRIKKLEIKNSSEIPVSCVNCRVKTKTPVLWNFQKICTRCFIVQTRNIKCSFQEITEPNHVSNCLKIAKCIVQKYHI